MERHTRQRQALLDALARSGQALSPTELLTLAREAVPSLNLSTVYRQIRGLLDAERVVRVELPGQPARYEIAPSPESAGARSRAPAAKTRRGGHDHGPQSGSGHHHHFHCVACDRVFPIHACPGPMNHLAPAGFEVQHHDLTLRGRCASCVSGAPQ
jgi:Fur family ferric uptake transcriptional regulator